MGLNRFRCRRKSNMDEMMDSPLLKTVAVGALVYLGTKALRRILD
ncbi:Hypothetical protein LUCI_4269 [Lucifera butyrica]|uniref:Uncharacterized protein n=1 Tax=Lucifera butyrica TaxID=1351585 RepID=A0A498RFW4_9FIRM|nr:Hypothetical protein LUCI_4269 [Lucifera butyrica]